MNNVHVLDDYGLVHFKDGMAPLHYYYKCRGPRRTKVDVTVDRPVTCLYCAAGTQWGSLVQ